MNRLDRRAVLAGLSTIGLAGAFGGGRAQAQPSPEAPTWHIFDAPPPTHTLMRHDLVVDGRGYRLFMAIPRASAPAAGWPALWMLDGNAVFNRLAAADLVAHPHLAVVAVGYPVERVFETDARALDYTPPSLIPDPERGRGRETGGADAFRARLTGPLRQAAGALAPLDPARQALWGHSYGGLFTLHCLLSQPDAFAGWAAASPSTSFGGGVLRHMVAAAPHRASGKAAPLHILFGDSERRRGTPAPAEPRPSPESMALAEALRLRPDLDVTVHVLEGLGHGQTFAASFTTAFDMAASLDGG